MDSQWGDFLSWTVALAETYDVESEEVTYKLGLVERLRTARDSLLAGKPDWLEDLNTAFQGQNLIRWTNLATLRSIAEEHHDAVRSAVLILWGNEFSDSSLDRFQDALAKLDSHEFSPANALSFGAWLLMAIDPGVYPPYKQTPFENWLRLTGQPKLGQVPPSQRYERFVTFLDEFQRRAIPLGLPAHNRLWSQALCWLTTEWRAPATWPEDRRRELTSWQFRAGADQRAWLIRPHPRPEQTEQWATDATVTLPAAKLEDLKPNASRTKVDQAIDEAFASLDYERRRELAATTHRFLTQMGKGDLIATPTPAGLQLGTIISSASRPAAAETWARQVEWYDTPIPTTSLPGRAQAILDQPGTIVEATDILADLLSASPTDAELPDDDPRPASITGTPLGFRPLTEADAAELHIDLPFLT